MAKERQHYLHLTEKRVEILRHALLVYMTELGILLASDIARGDEKTADLHREQRSEVRVVMMEIERVIT